MCSACCLGCRAQRLQQPTSVAMQLPCHRICESLRTFIFRPAIPTHPALPLNALVVAKAPITALDHTADIPDFLGLFQLAAAGRLSGTNQPVWTPVHRQSRDYTKRFPSV